MNRGVFVEIFINFNVFFEDGLRLSCQVYFEFDVVLVYVGINSLFDCMIEV